MDLLSGPEWFARAFQLPGESKSSAVARLQVAAKIQLKTVYRVLREQKVSAETIRKIAALPEAESLDVARATLAAKEDGAAEPIKRRRRNGKRAAA
jgi:hypothetical protein